MASLAAGRRLAAETMSLAEVINLYGITLVGRKMRPVPGAVLGARDESVNRTIANDASEGKINHLRISLYNFP